MRHIPFRRLLKRLAVLAGLPLVLLVHSAVAATPQYVQGNYAVPQTPQTSVTVPYTATQFAGDLNVVIVGWNETTVQISSVTDTNGNVYQLAAGPTLLSGVASQSVY